MRSLFWLKRRICILVASDRLTGEGWQPIGNGELLIAECEPVGRALELLPQAPNELLMTIQGIDSPGALADLVAGFMDATPDEKQDILETTTISERLEKVYTLMESEMAKIIPSTVASAIQGCDRMRLMAMIFSKPWRPVDLARKTSAIPPVLSRSRRI